MSTTKLEIVTPDKIVYDEEVEMAILQTNGGMVGILPHHAPLLAGVLPHAMRIKKDGTESLIAVGGGLLEVNANKITVLAPAAELPIDIDVNRAQRAYDRAKERLALLNSDAKENSDIDFVRAELALKRAIARLEATKSLKA